MEGKEILSYGLPHVYTDGKRLLTKNLTPGKRIYGEELISYGGVEYRVWNPRRSKLAALILKGSKIFPFEKKSRILYLGAATGTTISHISDIVVEGFVYCVEVSRRAFEKLIKVCEERTNMMPLLADANKPEVYSRQIEPVDVLYQDIAQRNQVSIFLKNMRFLKAGGVGYLMVKARSIDVAAKPKSVYRKVKNDFVGKGLTVLEFIELDPYEKDHATFIVERFGE